MVPSYRVTLNDFKQHSNNMVWFGSTIFSTIKQSMIFSKCLIKSLLFVIAFEENTYKKFEVTLNHRVTSTNPNLLHFICSNHKEGWCAHFMFLNPIQDGGGEGGQKDPPTSFCPVTSTNVKIRPQNFLNFSFNSFDRLV